MTDPQFETRADLEAWAKNMVKDASIIARVGTSQQLKRALAQLRRVTIAHLHLPFEGEPKK
jgi:hypothetical protein